jgi:hypothetical protein
MELRCRSESRFASTVLAVRPGRPSFRQSATAFSTVTMARALAHSLWPAEAFLLPRSGRPTARWMHPEHPAVHLVEHFPAVSSQLILNLDRKLAAALLQRLGISAICGTGVVPCLQAIEQLAAQPIAPWPRAVVPA